MELQQRARELERPVLDGVISADLCMSFELEAASCVYISREDRERCTCMLHATSLLLPALCTA
jgi:hypothetical protein